MNFALLLYPKKARRLGRRLASAAKRAYKHLLAGTSGTVFDFVFDLKTPNLYIKNTTQADRISLLVSRSGRRATKGYKFMFQAKKTRE